MNIVYLNGQYIPLEDAKISVMDRGFLFGDGVYEYIPVYNGELFRFQEHLQRLRTSLEKTHIKITFSEQDWLDILSRLIDKNGGGHFAVYLQITRGIATRRDLGVHHVFTEPTIFAACFPLPQILTEVSEKSGVRAVTLNDIRWPLCYIKAITLLPNILLRQEAEARDAEDAILIRNEEAIEGTQSNLFIVKNSIIQTPPKTTYILGGTTRDLVIELAIQQKLTVEETQIPVATLKSADEIWLTSSSKEIAPVTWLDDIPINNGKPGPIWQRMIKVFRLYKQTLFNSSAQMS